MAERVGFEVASAENAHAPTEGASHRARITIGVLSRRQEQFEGLRVEQAWYGGEGGIRTHGRVTPTAVFETARFGRSRTSPFAVVPEARADGVKQRLQRVDLKASLPWRRRIFNWFSFRPVRLARKIGLETFRFAGVP
jgi:hypothetical protein